MGLIGRSEAIQRVVVSIVQIAPVSSTVLLTGETGTGKEIVARAVHAFSPRHNAPFLPLNISALNEGTLESELFGHEKGAFTDAVREKRGIFEAAGHGTVFLDEIGDVSPAMQVRLLRVLEEREFRRVGGTDLLRTEARVIAATNRNVEYAVRHGEFRADLYYRLRVFEIHLPPLRERREDIPLLIEYFVERFSEENGRRAPTVTQEAIDLFLQYDWPGNVRELRTVVERMLVTASADVITPEEVPDVFRERVQASHLLPAPIIQRPAENRDLEVIYRTLLELRAEMGELRRMIAESIGDGALGSWRGPHAEQERAHVPDQRVVDVEMAEEERVAPEERKPAVSLKELEREAIQRALREVNGNRREAARILGIGERTLYRKLREYGLS